MVSAIQCYLCRYSLDLVLLSSAGNRHLNGIISDTTTARRTSGVPNIFQREKRSENISSCVIYKYIGMIEYN